MKKARTIIVGIKERKSLIKSFIRGKISKDKLDKKNIKIGKPF